MIRPARRQSAMAERSERLQPLVVETRRGVQQFQRIREVLARLELTDGLTATQLIIETASRLVDLADADSRRLLPGADLTPRLIFFGDFVTFFFCAMASLYL